MILIWTKSKSPLSKVIRWTSGQDCSHFAVHFETLGLVLHSNLIGVHLSVDQDFFHEGVNVMHYKHITGMIDESAICLSMMRKIAGKGYAFLALFYFAWRTLLLHVFRAPLPEKNAWADSRQFLCTQVYDVIPDSIIPTFPHLDEKAMVTPHDLWSSCEYAT